MGLFLISNHNLKIKKIFKFCIRARFKVPPSELAPACCYDDVRNGTANHGQGAGTSKRGPILFVTHYGITQVPPSEQAPACCYDDVRNGTANHGQGAGNSKRGPIFDRQSSAAKCRHQINLQGNMFVYWPLIDIYKKFNFLFSIFRQEITFKVGDFNN
jgi:hypothetical protein